MLNRESLSHHLRDLANLVESCSEEQLLALEAIGLAALAQRPKTAPRARLQAPKAAPSELIEKALEELKSVRTRDEARAILNRPKTTVRELTEIGRTLGVSLKSGDKKEQIIAKIVEFHVGAGLNSQAMQPAATNPSWGMR
jgi:hypothetical protein